MNGNSRNHSRPRHHYLAGVLAGLAAIVLAGCGGPADTDASASGSAAPTEGYSLETGMYGTDVARQTILDADVDNSEEVHIAWFVPTTQNAYMVAVGQGIEIAADARNATITKFDAGFEQQTQFSQIQDAVASGQYDAFIIDPVNSVGVVPAINEAAAAGVKVVCGGAFQCGEDFENTEASVEGVVAQTALPQAAIGAAMGRLIVEACADKDPCEVAQLPGELIPAEQANFAAIEQVLADHPEIEIVARVEAGYLKAPAEAATQDILQAHPDLDVVAAMSAPMAEGAELAAAAAGREDLALLALDGGARGIAKVRDGAFFGMVLMYPVDAGLYLVDQAVRAVRSQPFEAGINPNEELPWPEHFTSENHSEFGEFIGQFEG